MTPGIQPRGKNTGRVPLTLPSKKSETTITENAKIKIKSGDKTLNLKGRDQEMHLQKNFWSKNT